MTALAVSPVVQVDRPRRGDWAMKALGRSEHSNEERARGAAVAIMNTAVIRRKRFEVKYCVARRVVHVNFHALLLSPVSLMLSMPSFSHALLERRHLEF